MTHLARTSVVLAAVALSQLGWAGESVAAGLDITDPVGATTAKAGDTVQATVKISFSSPSQPTDPDSGMTIAFLVDEDGDPISDATFVDGSDDPVAHTVTLTYSFVIPATAAVGAKYRVRFETISQDGTINYGATGSDITVVP